MSAGLRPGCNFGVIAALLLLLEEQTGHWVAMADLATWLALPHGTVQDHLEQLLVDGLVRVERSENGPIVAAMAAPPEARDLAGLDPRPVLGAAGRLGPPKPEQSLPHPPESLEPIGTGFRACAPVAQLVSAHAIQA